MIKWLKRKQPTDLQNHVVASEQEIIETQDQDRGSFPQQEPLAPTQDGIFSRLKRGLSKTRHQLGDSLGRLLLGKKEINQELLEELETLLIRSDVGIDTTQNILQQLASQLERKQLTDGLAVYDGLKSSLQQILERYSSPLLIKENQQSPFVILMVGVNGAGKTTTIGKLAQQFKKQGKTVMLAAGDTFRAAAVEQLRVWGERNSIPVIAQHTGADSASVIFDALQAATARKVDVLIADTAGRLHTQSNLMEELRKIKRVLQKIDPAAPHETMLVLDASIGQNALIQAKQFHEAIGVSGITMTKLDGTAKGGILFAIANDLGLPFRYLGIGEGIDNLKPFDAAQFIGALFDDNV